MKKRVLIVDDSRMTRHMIGKMVQNLGFEILEAADGSDALEILVKDQEFQLVLIDWNMPKMTGLELVQNLVTKGIKGGMKLMMCTTENELPKVVQALNAGADEFLMKPFDEEMLSEKVSLLDLGAGVE